MIQTKRIYKKPLARDGIRILVDRVWPRGMSKARARLVEWCKELAPSTSLRKWFGHDPTRWTQFYKRYRVELKASGPRQALKKLARLSTRRTLTLVYSAADEEHNQAVALKTFLDELASRERRKPR